MQESPDKLLLVVLDYARYCGLKGVLAEDDVGTVRVMLRSVNTGCLELMQSVSCLFAKNPEAAIEPMGAFLDAYCEVMNDWSSSLLIGEETLLLVGTTSARPAAGPFARGTGKLTYSLRLRFDGGVSAHCHHADDRLVGVSDARSGAIDPNVAMEVISGLFRERLAMRCRNAQRELAVPLPQTAALPEAVIERIFRIGNVAGLRRAADARRAALEREWAIRQFAGSLAAAKTEPLLKYWHWRLLNWRLLSRYEGEIEKREKKRVAPAA